MDTNGELLLVALLYVIFHKLVEIAYKAFKRRKKH